MLISTDYLFSILFSMVIKRVACFVAADIPQGSEKGSSSWSASCKCRPCYSAGSGGDAEAAEPPGAQEPLASPSSRNGVSCAPIRSWPLAGCHPQTPRKGANSISSCVAAEVSVETLIRLVGCEHSLPLSQKVLGSEALGVFVRAKQSMRLTSFTAFR